MHMWTGGRASGGVWAGSEGGFTYGHTAASAGLEGDSPGSYRQRGGGGRSQGWRAGAVFSSACPTVAPKGEEEGKGQKLLSTTPLLCRVLAVGRVWGEI